MTISMTRSYIRQYYLPYAISIYRYINACVHYVAPTTYLMVTKYGQQFSHSIFRTFHPCSLDYFIFFSESPSPAVFAHNFCESTTYIIQSECISRFVPTTQLTSKTSVKRSTAKIIKKTTTKYFFRFVYPPAPLNSPYPHYLPFFFSSHNSTHTYLQIGRLPSITENVLFANVIILCFIMRIFICIKYFIYSGGERTRFDI